MSEQRSPSALPKPSPDAAAHSARLAGVIRAEIDDRGWIGFDRFMSLALYAPGLGYYSTGRARFGAEGDYVTAPSLSPLFGRCLARQCAEVLEATGGDIFELGAGDATLAIHLLEELARLDRLPDRYVIFEPSAGLRERQQQRVEAGLPPDCRDRVRWLDQPPREPYRGVVLANEVVDALPVRCFRQGRAGVEERGVANRDPGFDWAPRPADGNLARAVERCRAGARGEWPEGYSSEYLPGLDHWLDSVTHALTRGLVLVIDYGYPRHEYYHPQRSEGTLVCHYRHLAHDDPFLFVGLQDITAFVDFTLVAEAADAAGLEVAGYTTQGAFLAALGLAEMLEAAEGDTAALTRQAAEARRLIMPGDMGDRFKVMALTRDLPRDDLLGFARMDLREQLLPAG